MAIVVTEILDMSTFLGYKKTHNVSSAVSASVFRWNEETGEGTAVDTLQRASVD